MDKFLYTDGTNGVKEVQSQQELENLIALATRPDAIRIWLFNSNEWISYAAFRKLVPALVSKNKALMNSSPVPILSAEHSSSVPVYQPVNRGNRWLKKTLYFTGAAAGIFLVFNFTKIKWEKVDPVMNSAVRPANVPVMDIDSLIYEIEDTRGQSLDRNTKSNLRLRNTWPERILLQVKADRETNSSSSRFFNIDVSIDNTTGLNLDNAVVKLSVWNNMKLSLTDTVSFGTIRYDKIARRELDFRYKGDSISVSFESIGAKAFNFCYAAATKNNAGNYNDRWFCRE
ncbi:MAG: hypothetical protein SGI83_17095 [Bacteroidota bacterium]|nr:hypothetical protein [Bacteroidota bacterium]